VIFFDQCDFYKHMSNQAQEIEFVSNSIYRKGKMTGTTTSLYIEDGTFFSHDKDEMDEKKSSMFSSSEIESFVDTGL
jgi:hypothetical protein